MRVDLRFKELMNTQFIRLVCLGVVPVHQEVVVARLRLTAAIPTDAGREMRTRPPAHLVMSEHAGNTGGLEQIRVVGQRGDQLMPSIGNMESEIEVSSSTVHLQRIQGQAWQFPGVQPRILQHEHHLEERIAAQIARYV